MSGILVTQKLRPQMPAPYVELTELDADISSLNDPAGPRTVGAAAILPHTRHEFTLLLSADSPT